MSIDKFKEMESKNRKNKGIIALVVILIIGAIIGSIIYINKLKNDDKIYTIEARYVFNGEIIESDTFEQRGQKPVVELDYKTISGYIFDGFYQDEDCTRKYKMGDLPYDDAPTIVFILLKNEGVSIGFPGEQIGYKITDLNGNIFTSDAIAEYEGTFKFKVAVDEGYNPNEIKITAKGIVSSTLYTVTKTDDVYSIDNVTEAIYIEVSNLKETLKINVNLGDEVKSIYKNKDESKPYLTLLESLGLNESNTMGFYSDPDYKNLVDIRQYVINDSPLYTRRATLDCLEFNGATVKINTHYDDYRKIRSVVIPLMHNGTLITTLGEYAFSNCYSLIDVFLPMSITTISQGAFYSSHQIYKIVIPKNVTAIGKDAFSYFDTLKEIDNRSSYDFESNMETIGLDNKTELRIYSEGESNISSDANGFVFNLFNDEYKLISYKGGESNVTLPTNYNNKSYVIGSCAFGHLDNLNQVIIPNGAVTAIEDYAFRGSNHLYYISIPESVEAIEPYFAYIDKLVEIKNESSVDVSKLYFPYDDVRVFAEGNSTIIYSGDYVFSKHIGNDYYLIDYLGSETNIVLPDYVQGSKYIVRESTFANYDKIKTIKITQGVKQLGSNSFASCSSLETVVIDDGVVIISEGCFDSCFNLKYINIPASITNIMPGAFSSIYSDLEVEFSRKYWFISYNDNTTDSFELDLSSNTAKENGNLIVSYSNCIWTKLNKIGI